MSNFALTSTLRLSYRPPYDWTAMLEFLGGRTLKGVEVVSADSYTRTVALGKARGWIRVTDLPGKSSLLVEFTHSLTPVLQPLLRRLRHLFDTEAHPQRIAEHLSKDEILRPMIDRSPGLRVPGAFDGFELAVRAILGQQVSVQAATTIACRYEVAFGTEFETPIPGLTHLTPAPEQIATVSADEIAKLGIVGARARCIVALAKVVADGTLKLETGGNAQETIAKLVKLPGIGPWTAHYMAMRVLGWPDAFPKEDIMILKNLGGVTSKQGDMLSQAWRPWRSYAVMHIWGNSKISTR